MISIITVTYNNFDDLYRTLCSLEKIEGIEKVVVNGGYCAKTKDYLSDFDGVAISEPDKGISDAFNKGVSKASGENVMFLNSGDVLLSPDYPAVALYSSSAHIHLKTPSLFLRQYYQALILSPIRV